MMLFSVLCFLIHISVANAESCGSSLDYPNSCLDILKGGEDVNGYYRIAGANGETWNVYCDFKTELRSAWTLVMSWSFRNAKVPAFRNSPLTQNVPVNEKTPNWAIYRMSLEQMDFLKTKSTHWRATCSFDQVVLDYRDYMRGKFTNFDLTTFLGASTCKEVEYINVRGHIGHQTVAFWQGDGYMLHTDSSSSRCSFDASSGAKPSEDNFGHYGKTNSAFRCTAGPSATTQYWFGGYL